MKPLHIVVLLAIAISVGIIASSMSDASQYVNFSEASKFAENGKNDQVHVVGQFQKDNAGNILGIEYNPALNPNLLVFNLIDDKGRKERVIYKDAKPQDFERSEKVVVIGSFKGKEFVAEKILMKCPSKYQGQEKA
jgi:cytochrome c-type biogenesis protein CcmE